MANFGAEVFPGGNEAALIFVEASKVSIPAEASPPLGIQGTSDRKKFNGGLETP